MKLNLLKNIQSTNAFSRSGEAIENNVPYIFIGTWVFYLLLSPYYFFRSGVPQPGDMILTLGMIPALIFAFTRSVNDLRSVFIYGFLFALLTFMVNMIYYGFIGDKSFIPSSLFYLFNFMVFSFVIFLFKTAPLTVNFVTYYAIAANIVMQTLIVIYTEGSFARHEGTFNNPNQLAYWSLFSACILIVLKRETSLTVLDLFLLACLAYIQSQALSKAGLITFGMLVAMIGFFPVTNQKLRFLLIVFVFIVTITKLTAPGQVVNFIANLEQLNAVSNRLGKIGVESDDSASVRGYSRLIDYPAYMLSGAGEGAHWRFNARQELHSGVATILFSYGILGITLFVTFLYQLFKRLPLYHLMLLFPIILYGLTHQNFRNTGFWVFLGVCYGWHYFKEFRDPKKKKKKNADKLGID